MTLGRSSHRVLRNPCTVALSAALAAVMPLAYRLQNLRAMVVITVDVVDIRRW